MTKCPFCQFENEDGALFCEQCKSDLALVEAAQPAVFSPPPMPTAEPIFSAMPAAEPIPQAEPMAAETNQFAAETQLPAAVVQESAPSAPPPVMEAPPAPAAALPAGATPKLVVIRGVKINAEYPIYDGENFIGRADEKPVDIDLEDQEPPDRIWSSRQHAVIILNDGVMTIEDLNSSNGTYVNRTKVYPGQKRPLAVNDLIQIGTVHMRVKA